MKKMLSLIKACMTDNMSLFRIKKKDKNKKSGKFITIFLMFILGMSIYSYGDLFLDRFIPQHKEPVVLAIFAFITALFVVVEGVYKAGNLIFNCKDDDLLLSLPIRKSTVVFIRILKFYVFELLFSAQFMLPVAIAYAMRISVTPTFYLVSILSIFILPLIPIAISCLIGIVVSVTSINMKNKSIIQILVSMVALLGVLYVSINGDNLLTALSNNAGILEEAIARVYYPAIMYSKLATSFDVKELFIFIGVHLAVLIATIWIIGRVYFKINSGLKKFQKSNAKKIYKIRVNKPKRALIKKELKKAIDTPVLITNAVFGLVLLVIGCIVIAIKFDAMLSIPQESMPFPLEQLSLYTPIMLVSLVLFGALTSSITSSMISLEGKSFAILKSLPVKPYEIIMSKVHAAIVMMMPFIFASDLIFYIRFKFNIFEIILTFIASILSPLIAELIGILVNLNYPEMNAKNAVEVVKQSSSSTVSVLLGFVLMPILIIPLAGAIIIKYNVNISLILYNGILFLIFALLKRIVKTKGVEKFKQIDV